MKNAPYKIFRCPECTMNKRVREPESKPPPCPKCGSLKAYFSTNWYISITENGFPNKRDKSKPWSKLEHYWQQTKKKVGVEGKRFHDLKATGGTLFFLAMEDLRQTSLFLDHQDVNMTTRYIRIAEARKQKNMEKFEKILES